MRETIIGMIDGLVYCAVICAVGLAVLIGLMSGSLLYMFALSLITFIGAGLTCGFWLVLSGIYHNTKQAGAK